MAGRAEHPAGEGEAATLRGRVVAWIREPAPDSATAPWWDAGGHVLSIGYWVALSIEVAALFREKFLPFMDYPQHLALGAILHRMVRAGAPERALYDTNLASFNSMFHVLVAALAFVLPIERAGEAVLGASFTLTAIAMLRLLQATGRPRARAFLVIPLLSSWSLAWGFCNFTLGLAIQLIVLARVLSAPGQPPERRLRFELLTAALALLGMWAHFLASMIVYALMLAAILADSLARDEGLGRRITRALRSGAPLLPALVYVTWSYRSQQGMGDASLLDDNSDDVLVWDKARHFFSYLNGLRSDGLDAKLSIAAVLAVTIAWVVSRDRARTLAAPRWVFVAAVLLYLALPLEMSEAWSHFSHLVVWASWISRSLAAGRR